MLKRWVNLVFELLAIDRAAPSPGAGRITSLDHKIWDDAVEYDAIVVASLRKSREVLACLEIYVRIILDLGVGESC